MLPGARGCTPQSCAFRDHFAEVQQLGVRHLFGLSTQATDYQAEAAQRLHLPFALLSDAKFRLAETLGLPTFETAGMRLLKRLTLIVCDGGIIKTFYPVFPPDQNAEQVKAWLRGYPAQDLLFKRSPAFWRQSGRRPNESSLSNSVPYKSSESESPESL